MRIANPILFSLLALTTLQTSNITKLIVIDDEYDDDVVNFRVEPTEPVTTFEKEDKSPQSNYTYLERLSNNIFYLILLAMLKIEDFYPESAILLLILMFFINYAKGSKKNESLTKKWYRIVEYIFRLNHSVEYFRNEFAQLGDIQGYFLLRNTPDDFYFYCTGREGLKYLFGNIKVILSDKNYYQ